MSTSDRITDLFKADINNAIKDIIICSQEQSEKIADHILQKLQKNQGGGELYLPKPKRWDDIKKAFRGDNHAEVCKAYGISLRTLYRAIKK